jgi:hypothetical protein
VIYLYVHSPFYLLLLFIPTYYVIHWPLYEETVVMQKGECTDILLDDGQKVQKHVVIHAYSYKPYGCD